MTKRFKLFASCIIVNGFKESLIYDLERNTNYILPNDIAPILDELQKKSTALEKEYIKHFANQFIKEEIAFFTENVDAFLDLDLTWNSPFEITNAIIEYDQDSNYNLKDTINQLSSIGCQAIQFRINTKITSEKIIEYVIFFNETRIKCLDIILPFNKLNTQKHFFSLIEKQPRIRSISVFNAEKDISIESDEAFYDGKLSYYKKNVFKNEDEIIQKNRFIYSIPVFSEAQKHNLGLNRKVCISREGFIKNYISHNIIFGNINKDNIIDVVLKKEFQKKWYINNDQIEKCKSCQYRYTCNSNSDIEILNEKYYKIKTCNFNPFTNSWKNK